MSLNDVDFVELHKDKWEQEFNTQGGKEREEVSLALWKTADECKRMIRYEIEYYVRQLTYTSSNLSTVLSEASCFSNRSGLVDRFKDLFNELEEKREEVAKLLNSISDIYDEVEEEARKIDDCDEYLEDRNDDFKAAIWASECALKKKKISEEFSE